MFMRVARVLGRETLAILFPLSGSEKGQYLCGLFRMFPFWHNITDERGFQL